MNMDESKLSTELNLALQTPYDERVNSMDLNVGYNEEFREWELIVRYTGDIEDISNALDFTYTELLNGYAIIRIRSEDIATLTNFPQIIFVEKPKQLYAEQYDIAPLQNQRYVSNYRAGNIQGFDQSCMGLVQIEPWNLTGTGMLVGVIDSGIDIRHPAFIRSDGSSRILSLWDQSIQGNPPEGMTIGVVFTKEDIEHALQNPSANIMSYDNSGHGTGVSGVVTACVPDADLIVVKLNTDDEGGFPRTTALMLAVDYVVRFAIERQRPLVVNLSFGNNYGNHNGNSVLEAYLDSLAGIARLTIAVGMGNDGNTGRHISTELERGIEKNIEIQVPPYMTAFNLQAWYSYSDEVDLSLITPTGEVIGPFSKYQEVMSYTLTDMYIQVLHGYPTPINRNQETYISMIPKQTYIREGIWTVRILPRSVREGRFDMWLPVEASTSSNVHFLASTPDTSMSIPASASTVISVGAYNSKTFSYAPFSGRGYTVGGVVKPDISAPGVDIDVPIPGGGLVYVSGTSFATPFVAAGAAMLMQWGIVENHDPYLYGEKVRAYLIKGARTLPGYVTWPNEQLGWGTLCVRDSIPQ